MTTDPAGSKPPPPWKWGVVVMMLFATVINYLDRAALGNLSKYTKKPGSLSPALSASPSPF